MGAAIAFPIISAVVATGISYIFPNEGPRLRDTKVSASTYGNIIPEVYGTARVAGNMIWSKPFTEKKKKKKAGKGGSYYNQYTYFVDFAMAFCKGPIKEVRRIWADGKVIYDTTGNSEVVDNNKYRFRFYNGDQEQLPDSLIMEDKGVDYTPGYRGLCYVVFDDFALADFGNRIPQIMAEVYAGNESGGVITDVTPLTGDVAPSPPSGAYQLDQAIIDTDRGYFYQVDGVSNPRGGILRRFKLSDGFEDRRELVLVEPTASPPSIYDNAALTSVRGLTSKGELLCVFGGINNNMRIEKLDPYSWTSLGTLGRSFPFDNDTRQDWNLQFSNTNFKMSRDEKGDYQCITLGVFGQYNVFDPNTMTLLGQGQMAGWGGPGTPMYICGRTGSSPGRRFYHVTYTGGPTLQICSLGEVLYNMPIPATGIGAATGWCFFDEGNPGVVFFFTDGNQARYIAKWSEATGAVAWMTKLSENPYNTYPVWGMEARIRDNELHWVADQRLYSINTSTGKWIDRNFDQDYYRSDNDKTADQVNEGEKGYLLPREINDDFVIYDPRRNIVIGLGNPSPLNGIVHLGAYNGQRTTVGHIVEKLLVVNGQLTQNDYDLTPLYEIPVRGYGYATSTDIKSIISELRNLFMFDLVESDGKLIARVRGDEVADVDISWRVLGTPGGGSEDKAGYWKETRMSEADLPASIDLVYMNVDDDFNPSTAKSKRISAPIATMLSRQQVKTEANLVMDATEAKNRVNVMLYTQWDERTQHNTALPWAYLHLDPSDLISVTMEDGRNYFDRIGSLEFGADFSSRLETYGTDSGAYLSEKVGDGGGAGRPPVVAAPRPVVGFILNLPLLRDTDDSGGAYSNWYSAMGAGAPGAFAGGTLYRSNNGQDYDDLYQETESAEWGSVVGIVPPANRGYFALDWETRINIKPAVDFFDLESITDDELWEGQNPVIIGNEVMQFRDAVENPDGTWTIWNLLRGRRGTEWACDKHVAGERFLFLDDRSIEYQAENLDAAGKNRWYKAVGAGMSAFETDAIQINYQPRDLMPYAVNDIRRATAGADVVVTWSRRNRFAADLKDGTGVVPMSEGTEAYEAYVLAAPFDGDMSRQDPPAAYLRKYDLTSPTFTYLSADQTADGYDVNLDTLHVVIYQLSSAVGRGFPNARSIEPWQDF